MFEAIIAFIEVNVIWIASGILLLTICNIAFDVFKEHKKRKWIEKSFRGTLTKIVHKPM